MRKILSKIHTRLGLFCAPLLVLFGLTSLQFNHNFSFINAGESKVSWEEAIVVADSPDDNQLAVRIRQALGLKGLAYYWAAKRGEDGSFTFPLKHPGKSYLIRVDAGRRQARVEETRFGALNVLCEMHGGRPIDGSIVSWFWMAYTDISVAFVVFAGASGLYFWSRRRNARLSSWLVLSLITGGSLLLMLYVRIGG